MGLKVVYLLSSFIQQDEHADVQDDKQRLLPEGNSYINNALLKIARETKQKQQKLIKRLFDAQSELSVDYFALEELFITKDNIPEVIGNLSMSDIVSLTMMQPYSRRTAAPITCAEVNCNFQCSTHDDTIEHYTTVHGIDPPTTCHETSEATFENMTVCTCDHVRTVGIESRFYCRKCNKLLMIYLRRYPWIMIFTKCS